MPRNLCSFWRNVLKCSHRFRESSTLKGELEMTSGFIERVSDVHPVMKYESIRDLAQVEDVSFLEYPEPTVIFAPISEFSTMPKNLKRLPRLITRPTLTLDFQLDHMANRKLSQFEFYEDPDLAHPIDFDVIGLMASQRDAILIAFYSCPTGDSSMRELKLITAEVGDLGFLPIIWNAKIPDKGLTKDSFIPHVDCYHRGTYLAQFVKSLGDYYNWRF